MAERPFVMAAQQSAADPSRVPEGRQLVFCSGQLGILPDKTVPPDCAGQARICFDSIAAILAEANMTLANIVRINAFVSGREHLRPYMEVRNRLFAEAAHYVRDLVQFWARPATSIPRASAATASRAVAAIPPRSTSMSVCSRAGRSSRSRRLSSTPRRNDRSLA